MHSFARRTTAAGRSAYRRAAPYSASRIVSCAMMSASRLTVARRDETLWRRGTGRSDQRAGGCTMADAALGAVPLNGYRAHARVPESSEKNQSDTGNRSLERQQHPPDQSLTDPALGAFRESSEGGWPAFEGESRERETLHKAPLSYCVSHRFL